MSSVRKRETAWGAALVLSCVALLMLSASKANASNAVAKSVADSMVGLWQTQEGDAHIRIDPCGDQLCGSIVWMNQPLDDTGVPRRDIKNPDASRRDDPVQGMTILRIGTRPDGKGVLRDGEVYDPKSGRTYRCTLRADGQDALKMRGFRGISLLGKTTRWVRLAEDTDALGDALMSDGR